MTTDTPPTSPAHPNIGDLFDPVGRRMLYLYCTLMNVREELEAAAEAGHFDAESAKMEQAFSDIVGAIWTHIRPEGLPLTQGLPELSDYARADIPDEEDDAEEASPEEPSAE